MVVFARPWQLPREIVLAVGNTSAFHSTMDTISDSQGYRIRKDNAPISLPVAFQGKVSDPDACSLLCPHMVDHKAGSGSGVKQL
jgi:hypothetical protein